MAHDVFISYSAKDRLTAFAVCAALEAARIRCWIAPRDLIAGANYGGQLTVAIKACKALVLIFSENSNVSSAVLREVELAAHVRAHIVNFRVDATDLGDDLQFFLQSRHWLDALTPPMEAHHAALVESLRKLPGMGDSSAPTRPGPAASPPADVGVGPPVPVDRKTGGRWTRLVVVLLALGAIIALLWAAKFSSGSKSPGEEAKTTPPPSVAAPAAALPTPSDHFPPSPQSDPIVGVWTWLPRDQIVTIKNDGTCESSYNNHGTWERSNPAERQYVFRWKGRQSFEDTLQLSEDGSRLSGSNQSTQHRGSFLRQPEQGPASDLSTDIRLSILQAEPGSVLSKDDLPLAEYRSANEELTRAGYFLFHINGYTSGSKVRFAATWLKGAGPAEKSGVGMTSSEYQTITEEYANDGYQVFDVSGYEVAGVVRYAAIWMKNSAPWATQHAMSAEEYSRTYREFVDKGYRLVRVVGYPVGSDAQYAAIWAKNTGQTWVSSVGMTTNVFQEAFAKYSAEGYRLDDLSVYTVKGQEQHAAIWTQAGGRPYVARSGLNHSQYREIIEEYDQQGFTLVHFSVYTVEGEPRYAAIWHKQRENLEEAEEGQNSLPWLSAVVLVLTPMLAGVCRHCGAACPGHAPGRRRPAKEASSEFHP